MILITGGTGFIGNYLVEELVKRGEDIRVLVRNKKPKLEVEAVKGDVADRDSLKKAFNSVDRVYHLAALFRHDANEKAPYDPNPNAYSRSKAKAEQLILRMREKGLDSVIVRPAFVYGVGSRYGLNLLIEMVAKRWLRWVIGNGNNYIHPIHVKDLVKALITVMEKGREEVYIAANEKPVRLRELLDLVAEYAGVKLRYGFPTKLAHLILKVRGGMGGSSAAETISLFSKNWFYRVDRLKSLGWSQEIDVEAGIGEVVGWLIKGVSTVDGGVSLGNHSGVSLGNHSIGNQ